MGAKMSVLRLHWFIGSKVKAILLNGDFAYCRSCIGKGLLLKPAQLACYLHSQEFVSLALEECRPLGQLGRIDLG